jgi:hypothetical protein
MAPLCLHYQQHHLLSYLRLLLLGGATHTLLVSINRSQVLFNVAKILSLRGFIDMWFNLRI